MKIAHISDLHLNTFFRDSHLKEIKTVLRYCKEHNVDHIVITGDLTDNASDVNLNILRKSLIYFGYDNGEKLSVVIGNHDIFGGIQKAEEIFSFPERCRKTDYVRKVQSFNEIMNISLTNCLYQSENLSYPFAKIIGNVLLVGINSNAEYSTISNPFASNGEVTLGQFNEVAKILTDFSGFVKYKIILIHHHFNKIVGSSEFSSAGLWQNIEKQTMKLRKKKRLIALFNDFEIDAVLHGHLHHSQQYERGRLQFVNSGGAIKGLNTNKLKFHLVTFAKSKVNIDLKTIPKEFFKEQSKVEFQLNSVNQIEKMLQVN